MVSARRDHLAHRPPDLPGPVSTAPPDVTTGRRDHSADHKIRTPLKGPVPDQFPQRDALDRPGSVFGEDSQRIVRIDGYSCDLIPEGHMLVIWNTDVPGVIGEVATALGAHNVNIGFGSYAREKRGGMALTVYVLDSEVDVGTLEHLENLPNVQRVKYAHLKR